MRLIFAIGLILFILYYFTLLPELLIMLFFLFILYAYLYRKK